MDLIEILDIIVVPIVVALVTFWANIPSHYRKLTFDKLIFRELKELSPFPKEPIGDSLKYHLQTNFIHRKIFNGQG